MSWKKYPIRALKYVIAFYLVGIILYYVMHVVGGNSLSTMPDLSTLFTPRLLLGLTLLGVCYPLIGFNSASVALPEGGWEKHGKPLHEAMARCHLRFKRNENGKLVFGAESPVRRVLTVFEDELTLELQGDNTLVITGLRKDVALARLCVNDYVRRAAE